MTFRSKKLLRAAKGQACPPLITSAALGFACAGVFWMFVNEFQWAIFWLNVAIVGLLVAIQQRMGW